MMSKGRLADYFERNFLEWQLKHGRTTQAKFAKLLHLSPGYLNYLLEGRRTSVTFHAAIFVADLLNDYEILDILGFEHPVSSDEFFPPDIRSALDDARSKIKALGVAGDSPEAVEIITDALKKVGYALTSSADDPDLKK